MKLAAPKDLPKEKETVSRGSEFGVKLAAPKEILKEKETVSRGSEVSFGVKLSNTKGNTKNVS